MPYLPIELDSKRVPESIRAFVAGPVEMYLRDVRAMLEHPRAHNLPALNYSIASMLCAVIGGLSRVFYNGSTGDERSFKAVAKRYPMREEPAGAIRDKRRFAHVLYKAYRCNLVHSLGLNMAKRKKTQRWTVTKRATSIKVARWATALPLSERQLEQLDQPSGWPRGLSATFMKDGRGWRLDADALYCGVRRLVRIVAEDPKLRAGAAAVLGRWYDASVAKAKPLAATTSATTPTIQHTNAALGASSNSLR